MTDEIWDQIRLLYEKYPQYKQALHLVADLGTHHNNLSTEQARQILTEILSELEESSTPNVLWIAIVKSAIGCLLIGSGEAADGEKVLTETIIVLEQFQSATCEQIILSLNALAIARYQRGDIEKAKLFLEKAERLADEYPPEGQLGPDRNHFSSCNAQTVFLLAQIYMQSSESGKAALYCYKTLQQQILSKESNPGFDSFEWASNCIKLSAFYLNNNRLRQAKYCIDVSQTTLPEGKSERDQFIKADIQCAYGEVYARLLNLSAELHQRRETETSTDSPHLDNTLDEFITISVEPPACFRLAEGMEDARAIFRDGLAHFQAALQVYTLNGFVTDHVVLLQKTSGLLKDLSSFCSDKSHICKLHKRRIDLLEPVIDKLNPKIYTGFVRQLLHEVAQAYSDMADCKIEQVEQNMSCERQSRSKKINCLIAKSINYFEKFIGSLRDCQSSTSIEQGYFHVFLKAKFQLARLYSRFICSESESKTAFLKSSLHQYEDIVRLYKEHTVDEFKEEFGICQTMCSLLPLKIQSLSVYANS